MNPPLPNLFDPANAAILCQYSRAAYLLPPGEGGAPAPDEGPPRLSNLGYQITPIKNDNTDTLLLIDHQPDDTIIAFRGTQDLRNWLTDFDCRLVPLDSFRVHRGFHAALQSVWPELKSQISNLIPSPAGRGPLLPAVVQAKAGVREG